MADLAVIVPSRGRPAAAHELHQAFVATCTTPVRLVFAIDKRDSAGIYDYPHLSEGQVVTETLWFESSTMVQALNLAATAFAIDEHQPSCAVAITRACSCERPYAVGFMGDDHRPRTAGWDRAYLDTLRDLGTGMVYGNDLLQGERLPTQIAMTSDIVRALGWMAPPALTHLCVDDWWLALGQAVGCIRYLPDVVVEHMHPVAGKADWDDGHRRVNAPEMYARDRVAFQQVLTRDLPGAVARIRALRQETA